MAEREKVVRGLEVCTTDFCSEECPYYQCDGLSCHGPLMRDALALIKSLQEDIEVWKKRYRCVAIERKTANDPNKEPNIVKVFTTEEMEIGEVKRDD